MNEQKRISDWLTLAGVESPEKPQFPANDKLQLALGLVLEELTEAAEAASYRDCEEFLTTSIKTLQEAHLNLTNSKDKKEEGDLYELRDACADMRVVMGNLIHFSGIKEKFNEDFEKVMDSNFSKFCKTEQEAKDSVEAYILGTHPNKMGSVIDCNYEKVGEYWIVKRVKDNKLMKSIGFVEPNFTKV
jgi:predicted HAD superfamily Cof-like phosphohydrolase